MIWKMIAGAIVRWALTSIVGWLVLHKVMDPQQQTEIVKLIDSESIAIAVSVVLLLWSVLQKLWMMEWVREALHLPQGSSEEQLFRGRR